MGFGNKRRLSFRWAAFSLLWFASVCAGLWWLVVDPKSPLPDHWNPTRDLNPLAPATPITRIQLRRALSDTQTCQAALKRANLHFDVLEDLENSKHCGIEGRVRLTSLGHANINPVETRCVTALRLVMWERHVVQPAARDLLSVNVSELRQIGSYNCRKMRSTSGNQDRWSSHAKANSIDITGVSLSDGRELTLLNDWEGHGAEAAFLRRIGEGSCDWFQLVLGPNYNRLHADHFHLQHTGWGYCR